MKRIIIEPEECTGCRDCELVCSMQKTGEFNPAHSLIQSVYFSVEMVTVPITCMQCEEPLCQDVCPASAISRDMETDAVVIDGEKCIGCYMCVSVCPVGAIQKVPDKSYMTKCDLCAGEPVCVNICPTDALRYEEVDEYNVVRSRGVADEIRKVLKGVELR